MKVLLVGEDKYLSDVVTYSLKRNGYHVVTARIESDVLRKCSEYQPDLVLLDTAAGCDESYNLCREIRHSSTVPILYFGSCSDERDIVQAYESGVDDYIIKPFSNHLLMLRIAAAMRKRTGSQDQHVTEELNVAYAGDIRVDPFTHDASKNGSSLSLTRIEFRLLHYLVRNAGILLHFDRIADYVWQSSTGGDLTLLRTHVSRLRRKLAAAHGSHIEIRAVQRTGYMLTVAPPSREALSEPTGVSRAG